MNARTARIVLAAALVAATWTATAMGGALAGVAAYETGMRHYEAGRYAEALTEFTRAAHVGHVRAQEIAGMMNLLGASLYGEEVAQDRQAARRWLGRAAGQGSAVALLVVRRIDAGPPTVAQEQAR